ncbi:uncharacterized protein LOC134707328 [Mytilus trossulus]|uniref:uncharacterized protein LOC134707328 n=1 Tax=Mytilus trossulus TaxID=6551 RepID=UPI003007209B
MDMASDQNDNYSKTEELSRYIWKSYLCHGKANSITNIAKNMALVYDCISSNRSNWDQYSGGSTFDGTSDYGKSDVDDMIVFRGVVVKHSESNDSNKEKKNSSDEQKHRTVLVTESSNCSPGYYRLITAADFETFALIFGCQHEDLVEERSGKTYLSSDKFLQFMIKRFEHTIPLNTTEHTVHGPSMKFAHDNIYGYHINRPDLPLDHDTAHAIIYDQSPICMQEWTQRERRFNWPSQNMIEKIQKLSWHFVPVGDRSSLNFSLEWRLSFLLGERELAWNLNDTQIQCLVILKKLRNTLLEPVFPDLITSYHLKNSVCWLSEETDIDQWVPEQLLSRIGDCLTYLVDAVEKEKLPHYFHRQRNLFHNRFIEKRIKNQVISKLCSIRNNLLQCAMSYGLPADSHLSKYWKTHTGNIDGVLESSKRNKELNELFNLKKKVSIQSRFNQGISYLFANISDACESLHKLVQTSKAIGELLDVDVNFKTKILKCLDIQMGFRYYAQYINEENVQRKEELLRSTKRHFEDGVLIDDFTGALYSLSLHFCLKEYNTVISKINTILGQKKYLLYTGKCSLLHGIELGMPNGNIFQTSEAPVTADEDDIIESAFDFIFSRDHISCLPYPLQVECAMVMIQDYGERFILIHPAVYIFLLLQLSCLKIYNFPAADEALKHLEEAVSNIGENLHRYRSLNILGYSYSAHKRTNEALECYRLSLYHSRSKLPRVKNAAIYHVAILAYYTYKFYEFFRIPIGVGCSFVPSTDEESTHNSSGVEDIIYSRN